MCHCADAVNVERIRRIGLLSTNELLRRGCFGSTTETMVRAHRPCGTTLPNGVYIRDRRPVTRRGVRERRLSDAIQRRQCAAHAGSAREAHARPTCELARERVALRGRARTGGASGAPSTRRAAGEGRYPRYLPLHRQLRGAHSRVNAMVQSSCHERPPSCEKDCSQRRSCALDSSHVIRSSVERPAMSS